MALRESKFRVPGNNPDEMKMILVFRNRYWRDEGEVKLQDDVRVSAILEG